MSAVITDKRISILKLTKLAKLSTEDIIDFIKKEYPEMDNVTPNTKLDEEKLQKLSKQFKKEFESKEKADGKIEKLTETTNVKFREVEKKKEEEEREKAKLEELKKIEEENRKQAETIRKGIEDKRLEEEAKRRAEEDKAMKERRSKKSGEKKKDSEQRPSRPDRKPPRTFDGKEKPKQHFSKDKPGQAPRRDNRERPRREGDSQPHFKKEGDRPKTVRPAGDHKKSTFVKVKVDDNVGSRKPGDRSKSPYKKLKTDRVPPKDTTQPPKVGKKEIQKKEDLAKEKARRQKTAKSGKLREFTQKEIDDAIRETFSKIDEQQKSASSRSVIRKKKKKERLEKEIIDQEKSEQTKNVLKVTEYISTSELANLMNVEVTELIKKCFSLGMMVSINQRLEKDLIILLADEMGYTIEFLTEYEEDIIEEEDDPALMQDRPPVVTIMGHVDHGKTSLLDRLRNTNVVAGEAGGITQHIGAYTVFLPNGKKVTFLDTPGHEAFTSMRARGGQAADLVVLVVAADDNVMPQTVEAINHALAANVPIIVAINKIDKPDSNPERIKQQLSERNILVESWGGKFQSVEISAKQGLNLDELLEKILLEAELLQLKANPEGKSRGIVLEAKLDKGKGTVASLLVTKGTLNVGDVFICGVYSGKIKAMFDERENKIESAGPSQAVQVLGFDGMPQAGDTFIEMDSERDAKEIATKRQQLKREQDFRQIKFITLDDISKQIQMGEQVELNIILKADTDGSAEALADSLLKLATPEAKVRVIHKAVGQISESDVILAEASNAIIIGFNVRPNLNARKLAESKNIDIRLHNIIYNLIEEIKHALEGLLAPEIQEKVTCTVEVRDVFKVPKIGNIAGCYVQEGKITRNTKVRLLRDGFVIFDGNISSLKRIKDDVREVDQGYECGIGLENFNDIKVGDIIEGYEKIEIKRKLSTN